MTSEMIGKAQQSIGVSTDEESSCGDSNIEWIGLDSKRKKNGIMSSTALTADRLGLSYRQRAMYAATVAQASGVTQTSL
jgi:hypothetical protein